VPGKQGWFQENQPREGKAKEETWIGDVMDEGVPTCGLTERIGDIRERIRADGRDLCIVVTEQRVVLGLLRKKELASDDAVTAGEVMREGPGTFRPNVTLEEMLKFMREKDIKTNSLITTPEGRPLGIIARNDLEATFAHDASS